MERYLSELNITANDSQLKMGKASSDSAYASGVADSESMRMAAWGGIAGAGLSMVTAAGSLYKQHSNYNEGNKARDAESKLGARLVQPDNAIPPADAGGAPAGGANPQGEGFANLVAAQQEGAPVAQPPVQPHGAANAGGNQGGGNNQDAARQELTKVQADAKEWQNIWSNIAMHYPGAISKVADSSGNILAAGEKMKGASANQDKILQETIQSMMKTQSDLINATMQGIDGSANSAIQTIQALIQANRAG
jgi:hypothetical protein